MIYRIFGVKVESPNVDSFIDVEDEAILLNVIDTGKGGWYVAYALPQDPVKE